MENQKIPFSLKARIRSFKHAFKGVSNFFQTEHNALIHLVATVIVIAFGIWLSISRIEWIIIICMIGMVFTAELFNTAIEKLCDSITIEYNNKIKIAKDLSAAGVLIVALVAAIIGLIVFLPKLIDKLEIH